MLIHIRRDHGEALMLQFFDRHLSERPLWALSLVCGSLLIVLGILDEITGYEISFAVFYLIPILLASFYMGKKPAYVVCVLSACIWLVVEFKSGHIYTNDWIPIWNALTRLVFFILIAYLFSELKHKLSVKDKLIRWDTLTGILSLRAFIEDASKALKAAARYRYPVAIGYIDLDSFKALNDTRGHAVGDLALKATGAMLSKIVRGDDICARIGGDEFIVFLQHANRSGAEMFFKRLHSLLLQSMKQNNWPIGFTIGVAIIDDETTDLNIALERADKLMLDLKKHNKNTVSFKVFEKKLPDSDNIGPGNIGPGNTATLANS